MNFPVSYTQIIPKIIFLTLSVPQKTNGFLSSDINKGNMHAAQYTQHITDIDHK